MPVDCVAPKKQRQGASFQHWGRLWVPIKSYLEEHSLLSHRGPKARLVDFVVVSVFFCNTNLASSLSRCGVHLPDFHHEGHEGVLSVHQHWLKTLRGFQVSPDTRHHFSLAAPQNGVPRMPNCPPLVVFFVAHLFQTGETKGKASSQAAFRG